MPKLTPEQKRKASATELKNTLPAKGTGGETVVSNAVLKRAINRLER